MQRALLWKIALIVLIALLMQIPVGMIRGLVAERKQARDGVIAEIARGSSEAQRIAGPILYIPWTNKWNVPGIVPRHTSPRGFPGIQFTNL